MSKSIQTLVDVWEKRPRRQLDYSMLNEQSVADVQWTVEIITALIPSMREIREKFGVEPTPLEAPIVIQLEKPASQQAQPKEQAEDVQRKPVSKSPKTARNSRSRKGIRRKGGSEEAHDPVKDTSSKSSSSVAKPAEEHQNEPAATPSSPEQKPIGAPDMTDAPAPTLISIE